MSTTAVTMSDAAPAAGLDKKSLEKNMDHDTTTVTPSDADIEFTPAEERSLVRKIDWRIMPYLWGYAVLSAVDKIIISNAALYGMKEDTHLVGQQYSWVGSIFYFGYLVAEFPLSALLQRLPVGKLLSCLAFGWGLTTLLMATCHNAAGLMTLRFIMGMLEAPALPGLTLVTSMWYTKREQPLRVALWSSTVASVYVGLLSYGIGHAHVPGLANWKLLFIVLGGVSCVFAVCMFFFFPDSPAYSGGGSTSSSASSPPTAGFGGFLRRCHRLGSATSSSSFLSEREAKIAVARRREDNTGIENRTFKTYQVYEALRDWKSWAIAVFFLCMNVSNGGLNTFSAQIVSGFGFSDLATVLIGMPTGVIQAVSSILATVPPRYFRNARCLSAAACCAVPLACSVVIRRLPDDNVGGLLAAYYCFYVFWGPYAVALSLPMANTSGHTKKLTVNAMVFLAYCVANIVAPQTFREEQAPHYTSGYNAIAGFESAAIAVMLVYIVGVRWENARRDRKYGVVEQGEIGVEESMEDLTDWEKTNFRYVC